MCRSAAKQSNERQWLLLWPLLWGLLVMLALAYSASSWAGKTYYVDQRGETPGALTSIAAATAVVKPGDQIVLVPGSGPYREVLYLTTTGTQEEPITFDGSGETITGFDPFEFIFNSATGEWEYLLPPPIANSTPGTVDKPFRYIIAYQGQRLLVDYRSQTITSNFAVLSADGTKLLLRDALPSGWEIGVRDYAVRIAGGTNQQDVAWNHIYKNIRASGSRNDGFNVHGYGSRLFFENIEAFQNYDEGFSAHDSIHCEINGGRFWANDNGIYNQTTANIVMSINDVQSYANLGFGIAMRQGTNQVLNSAAWDNGINNLNLGGLLTLYSDYAYESRLGDRPWVSYQESQDLEYGEDVPYAYFPYGKPDTGYGGSDSNQYSVVGDEPTIVARDTLPAFSLGFDDWRYLYFPADLVDLPTVSGADVDPDSDTRVNYVEYQDGSEPLLPDSSQVMVSMRVPDAIAFESPQDTALFRIQRSGPTGSALSVPLLLSGSATADDYQTLPDYVEIPAGQSSVDIELIPVDDGVEEGPETVEVRLADGAGSYISGSASGTVIIGPKEQPTIRIGIQDGTASETGDTGIFRVYRDGPEQAVVVGLVVGGTAQMGVDYEAIPTQVSIPADAFYTDIVVSPILDAEDEGSETVTLTLVPDPEFSVSSSVASISIADVTPPTVNVTVIDPSANESGNVGIFKISKTGSKAVALTVHLAYAGTAVSGADYVSLPDTVVIPVGQSSIDLDVVANPDYEVEVTETVELMVLPDISYAVGTGSGVVSITDVPPPVVSVLATDLTANESGNVGTFRVSKTGSKSIPLTVHLSLSGTAQNGVDYQAIASSVEIPEGQSGVEVQVLPLADGIAEGTETVILTVDPDPTYQLGTSQASLDIKDVTPPAVDLSVSDDLAVEASTDDGAFVLTRGGSTIDPLTVYLSLAGSATNGADYQTLPSAVSIPAGQASLVIPVLAMADNLDEGEESVTLSVVDDVSYVIGDVIGTVYLHDGVAPTVDVIALDATATEGGADTGTFSITRTGATDQPLTVSFGISGTASNGLDYEAVPESVVIPAGASSAEVAVTPLDDLLDEGSESVTLTLLADPFYVAGAASASVEILDVVHTLVSVQVLDAAATEGADGASFSIARTGPLSEPLTVMLGIAGTATNGVDYQALPAIIEIPADQSAVQLEVTPISDALIEGTETVELTVLEDPAYAISGASGIVQIFDTAPPTVDLSVVDSQAAESGNPASIRVSRSGPVTDSLMVYLDIGGTASHGLDYQALPNPVSIAAGEASVLLTIVPIPDTAVEGTETVELTVVADPTYIIGASSTATAQIADAAQPTVNLSVPDGSTEEGEVGGAFSITRTGSTAVALTIYLDVSGTATSGVDYEALPDSVVIPAGSGSVTINVTANVDGEDEEPETVVLSLLQDPSYVIGNATGTVTISDAEVDLRTVDVSVQDASATESGNSGRFRISKSGDRSLALTVHLSLSGTATNGVDYAAIPATTEIPAGQTAVTITVAPYADSIEEGTEQVILTVLPDPGYTIGISSGSLSITEGRSWRR